MNFVQVCAQLGGVPHGFDCGPTNYNRAIEVVHELRKLSGVVVYGPQLANGSDLAVIVECRSDRLVSVTGLVETFVGTWRREHQIN